MNTCAYGCGQEAKFQLKNKKWCCSQRQTKCPTIRQKNKSGLKQAYDCGKRESGSDRYKGIPQDSKDRMAWSKDQLLYDIKDIFKDNTDWASSYLKKVIVKEKMLSYECSECKLVKWLDKDITLELDHINGKRNDNRLENLRFLCPNCHSQTDTYNGRNINIGVKKVSDEELYEAYKTSKNIRRTLLKLGLAPKGGNYSRLYQLLLSKKCSSAGMADRMDSIGSVSEKSDIKNVENSGNGLTSQSRAEPEEIQEGVETMHDIPKTNDCHGKDIVQTTNRNGSENYSGK